jgi:Bacterial SH3 domain
VPRTAPHLPFPIRRSCRFGFGSQAWALAVAALVAAASLEAGCAPKAIAPRAPAPPADDGLKREANDPADELTREVERYRAELKEARAEIARLRDQVEIARHQVEIARHQTAVAEEHFEVLRVEMDRALDDVLASKASLRGVNNRALAISRIAEVRVQMQSAGGRGGTEAAARLREAEALLTRADQALKGDNYGGAAYLADRAGEMIRQARTVAEVAARQTGETAGVIPIVPARAIEVAVTANLRSGPDAARPRVGRAKPGTRLKAIARLGEWFEVETEGGRTAWIHRSTVR